MIDEAAEWAVKLRWRGLTGPGFRSRDLACLGSPCIAVSVGIDLLRAPIGSFNSIESLDRGKEQLAISTFYGLRAHNGHVAHILLFVSHFPSFAIYFSCSVSVTLPVPDVAGQTCGN